MDGTVRQPHPPYCALSVVLFSTFYRTLPTTSASLGHGAARLDFTVSTILPDATDTAILTPWRIITPYWNQVGWGDGPPKHGATSG